MYNYRCIRIYISAGDKVFPSTSSNPRVINLKTKLNTNSFFLLLHIDLTAFFKRNACKWIVSKSFATKNNMNGSL